jgi:hypothetical protein
MSVPKNTNPDIVTFNDNEDIIEVVEIFLEELEMALMDKKVKKLEKKIKKKQPKSDAPVMKMEQEKEED